VGSRVAEEVEVMTEEQFDRLRDLAKRTIEDPEAAWESSANAGGEMSDIELARGVLSLLNQFVGEA
jgi:hypothetical protein